jgi:hypothetical protein
MQTQTSHPIAPRAMEHRWGERVPLDCPASLLLPDGSRVNGRMRNASISGALIDADERLPVYTTLNVRLATGEGPRRRMIELSACVVRVTRSGLAVEWRDMAEPTLIALLREAGGSAATLCARDHIFD